MRYLLVTLIFLSCACAPSGKGKALSKYDTPERSDEALANVLKDTCAASQENASPILIEFSAPWCGDCNKLHEMKQDKVLAKELESWPMVTINVGQFDRHKNLLKSFEVEAIASWFILTPSDCDSPVESWPRQANRTLEPKSGEKVTSAELAAWLNSVR